MNTLPLTDESLMWFGRYDGTKLKDVPVTYLHWCYLQVRNVYLDHYIEENLSALKMEDEDLIWQR